MKSIFSITLFTLLLINSASAQTAYYEDFESVSIPALPTGCSDTHSGGGNGWESHAGQAKEIVYDIPAHTQYCMVDNFNHYRNYPASFTTSAFSLLGLTNPHLSFDCIFPSFTGELAVVGLSTDGGATFTVVDTIGNLSTWIPTFANLSGVTPTANCKLRFTFWDATSPYNLGNNGIAIDNIRVYQPVSNDAGISFVTPVAGTVESFVQVGDSVALYGVFGNYGTATIPNYTIYWQEGSGPADSVAFTSSSTVPPFTYMQFSGFTMHYRVASAGAHTVKIWVRVPGDLNPANDTMTTVVTGINSSAWPTKKFFLEERTGTWCTWCPRGIVFMDSLWRHHADTVNIACVHGELSDPMATDNSATRAYDTFAQSRSGLGYPSVCIDRHSYEAAEWIYDILQYPFIPLFYGQRLMYPFGFANVTASKVVSAGHLNVNATVTPAINLTGDYRLELIVTEQDVVCPVTGVMAVYWYQQNAYATTFSYDAIDSSYNFNDSASAITDMKYEFVTRWTVPNNLQANPDGVAGSLPSSMTAGTAYSYTFPPVTIDSNWNPANLTCVALLIDNNVQSPNYGRVLNSSRLVSSPLATEPANINGGLDLNIYPNPAAERVNVAFDLPSASAVSATVYNTLGQKIFSVAKEKTNAGKQVISIPVNSIPAGIYTLSLQWEGGNTVRSFSVVK